MRVAVIGYGVEGQAAAAYWSRRGHDVTVCAPTLSEELPDGIASRVGPTYLDGIDAFDLIVRSPGVRPDLLPPDGNVTSVTREFLERCPGLVIGVTGTQGKGTTCTAIASILRAAGRTVLVGGNIGIPPLDYLDKVDPDDIVVLELSNFQLIDARVSPRVAVVLAVTPDHLNWHTDLDEYYAAKAPIAAHQRPDDVVVYDAVNPVAARIASASPARAVPFGVEDGFHARDGQIRRGSTVLVDRADIPLRGDHNLRNLTAAVAAVYDLVDGDTDALVSGVRSMRPLPHRLQPVGEIRGVWYVNDSLSTTPETTRAAIAAYPEPKVLILGGSSKGLSFESLAEAIASADIRALLLTGDDAPRIAAALRAAEVRDYEIVDGSMSDIVRRAAEIARPGDVVLLSPACASFDRYRDYADRGEQFVAAVEALRR
ncbi:UDP-N-acetylmuramoyl-L-alanine--D-glutamate ligase [Thermasporomyces composti]|uniref:UDP-N-acetylmuramoylalanine--D-glutamate ligase n=1 Tax=Thermasporomyces composti TaxID=696763 RepID=A0A3D9V5U9_THECX|nr:UDP-N-acetylmuramoyl-L-alanine--D-glutamate ligase [Thermasporomyces composti]REF36897.1 UDP-N-acetylmuramoylalanine--D-glutamate ligase [Thermasporomyces composti]